MCSGNRIRVTAVIRSITVSDIGGTASYSIFSLAPSLYLSEVDILKTIVTLTLSNVLSFIVVNSGACTCTILIDAHRVFIFVQILYKQFFIMFLYYLC